MAVRAVPVAGAAALGVKVIGHTADVDQVHGRDVVGSGTAANGPAAQGERGEQPGAEAHRALRGGRVDHDARNRLFEAEFADDFFVVGVDGKGVARAAVVQQSSAQFAGFMQSSTT